jgi:hypothetical protein
MDCGCGCHLLIRSLEEEWQGNWGGRSGVRGASGNHPKGGARGFWLS